MPTHQKNLSVWNQQYEWTKAGNEWSQAWGGPDAQWFGTILPRIHSFIPAETILEIAPGHGRWTYYLREYCHRLIGVDMAPNCVKICQERFSEDKHLQFCANDGNTLPMVGDHEVNFAFSFDSLVHAEAESVKSYLFELKRVLVENGVAFLHHSNIGSYARVFQLMERLPKSMAAILVTRGVFDRTHWRAFSVSSRAFQGWCAEAGLNCVWQELINWGGKRLIDCLSVLTPSSSRSVGKTIVVRNPQVMAEAERCRIRSLNFNRLGLCRGSVEVLDCNCSRLPSDSAVRPSSSRARL
jgi:hypothetical protein